ncbi:MAG: NADH-quinone oxidoreductase subunit L [Cytophagales bacterium]|nr:MAG: NADH-quinone oxidoreductase subunit L [Cytophagales bacterium]
MSILNLSNHTIFIIATLNLVLPLISFFILIFFAKKIARKGDWLGTAFLGINVLLSVILLLDLKFSSITNQQFLFPMDWFSLGSNSFRISFLINNISILMLIMVNTISFLVHLYSIEYMKGKRNYERYFPYLGIFTFAMIGIVLSNNLLLTFMFWELVGFSSYLLIGFWFDKEAAVKASKKAFLFNRIGDIGFLLALLIIYINFHSFEIEEIKKGFSLSFQNHALPLWISLAGLGFFAACVGKSAQFPLQIWLPDAMEGPTPVSALIHAATMVAAGVYLMIKVNFLLSPEVKIFIAFTGATTAFIGAVPALFQNDIKKVLAYSTISQLGYMVMGIGFESYLPSFFHLITHAFFKACLFLSVGAIIHAMHHIKHDLFLSGDYYDFDAQDMRYMGGFYKKMPIAFIAFIFSSFALIGIPLFSGALSKEILLETSLQWAQANAKNGAIFFYMIPILAYSTLLITTVYMFRQIFLIFFNKFRLAEIDPKAENIFNKLKENHWLINIPLLLLTLFSSFIVYSYNPLDASKGWLLQWIGNGQLATHFSIIPLLLIVSGVLIALYRKKALLNNLEYFKIHKNSNTPNFIKSIRNDWNMDALYYHTLVKSGFTVSHWISKIDSRILDRLINFIAVVNVIFAHLLHWIDRYIIDGILNLIIRVTKLTGYIARSIQSGKLQNYIVFLFAFIALIFIIIYYSSEA